MEKGNDFIYQADIISYIILHQLYTILSLCLKIVGQFVIFMTAPVTAFFYNILIFFGFMGFFIWVIMRKFCLRPNWQEYIVVVTLVAICMERVRKFAAMRGITNRQRIAGLSRDGYNTIFFFALLFMVFGVIFRSVVS